jgi:hypothetical protein
MALTKSCVEYCNENEPVPCGSDSATLNIKLWAADASLVVSLFIFIINFLLSSGQCCQKNLNNRWKKYPVAFFTYLYL